MDKITKFKNTISDDINTYHEQRKIFYDDPMHWSNNKRRRSGLTVLRGATNKYRVKVFYSYHVSTDAFNLMEEILDDALTSDIAWESFFDKFVVVKDLNIGDSIDVILER